MHKTILITGCSSGIGKASAVDLQRKGFRVIATARARDDLDMLEHLGLEVHQLDVTDAASITRLTDYIRKTAGNSFYGIYHNAGYGMPGAIEDLPSNALRQQFETNFFPVHEITQALLPILIENGQGRVVVCSSVLGIVAMPFRGAYTASKWALEGWSHTLRLELRGTGIDVVLIQPGPIETRFRATALQAFQSAIKPNTSRHEEAYGLLTYRLSSERSRSPFVMSAEETANVVSRAFVSRQPKAQYGVTWSVHAMRLLNAVLPRRSLDRILSMGI